MKTVTLSSVLLAAVFGVSALAAQGHSGHTSNHPPAENHPAPQARPGTSSAAPAAAENDLIGATDAAMSGPMSDAARKHMRLTRTRPGTAADTAKAMEVVRELRAALAKYADTSAAVADGYRMFMPNVRQQRIYHFTNYRNAMLEAFRFEPDRPTSLLYQRMPDGALKLVGGMYTAPRRMRESRLDERIPFSIARWHQHVNWCLPPRDQRERWLERRDGKPVFGPESPIATRRECEDAGGVFHANLFGWMVHANVFAGDDLAAIFGHEH